MPARSLRPALVRPVLRPVLRRALTRTALIGTTGLLVAGLLGGAPQHEGGTGDGADLAPVASQPASSPVTAFSLNIAHTLGPQQARADMVKAFGLGQVGGLQEMSDRQDRDTLVELAEKRNWGWYMPEEGGVAIPIIWDRARFRLIGGTTVRTHGPEAGVTPGRFINTAYLSEVATGKMFAFVNTHTISQASHDARASNPHRIGRLRTHLSMLRTAMQEAFDRTENVVTVGDLNVNYLADRRRKVDGLPTSRFGDLVRFDMPMEGSRGPTSLLDYVMSIRHDSGLVPTTKRIVHGFNSDHQAVVVRYRFTDVLAPGAAFSKPSAGTAGRRNVIQRTARLAQGTQPGEVLRIATPTLSDWEVVQGIRIAHGRGAKVRVLVGRGALSSAEKQVAAMLGTNRKADSWLVQAPGGHQASFATSTRSASATNVSVVSSVPATTAPTSSYGDSYLSTADAVHAGLVRFFDQTAAGTFAGGAPGGETHGAVQTTYLPTRSGAGDAANQALKPIGCRGGTTVSIAMKDWAGKRGRMLAFTVGKLRQRGCTVRVLAGGGVGTEVRGVLRKRGVAVRSASVHQALVVVQGRYGNGRDRGLVWTGSSGWNDGAVRAAGVRVRVDDRAVVSAHRASFDRVWNG